VDIASLEHGEPLQVSLCAWWDHGRLSHDPVLMQSLTQMSPVV